MITWLPAQVTSLYGEARSVSCGSPRLWSSHVFDLSDGVFFFTAPGPEAPPCQESGAVLWRLITKREPDRQDPSGLPGNRLLLHFHPDVTSCFFSYVVGAGQRASEYRLISADVIKTPVLCKRYCLRLSIGVIRWK